jgi:hypothetical protein
MKFVWNGDIKKTADLLDITNKHELRWFGIAIGWIGIGLLIGREKKRFCVCPQGEIPVVGVPHAICHYCGLPRR